MKKIFLFLGFILVSFSFCAQGLTAFEDYRRNFIVFDDGEMKTLEIQPVTRFQVGGKGIPYIDNLGYFKIYSNGQLDEITFGPNINFNATDHLISYHFNDQLWVYEEGKSHLLSIWVENFKVSDYTIAYLDNNSNSFQVYQNHTKTKLEDVLTGINNIKYKVGENIVAYVYLNMFKVFFAGATLELSFNNEPLSFEVGRNIVAFMDDNNQSFDVFYGGEVHHLEDFNPQWYQVADDMVIYKSHLGVLKAFYKGEQMVLSTNVTSGERTSDNVCTFIDQGRFMIFYDGTIKTLEFEPPMGQVLENNSVIYKDQIGRLKYFNGEIGEVITSDRIASYSVNLNTVTYLNTANRHRVFYKGRIY